MQGGQFGTSMVKGGFGGGCDIVREMVETGELTQFLTAR